MRKPGTGIVAFAALAAFGWAPAWAQVESKREAGMPKVTTSQITGEVVYIEGNGGGRPPRASRGGRYSETTSSPRSSSACLPLSRQQ
jgi:hypothetical protein